MKENCSRVKSRGPRKVAQRVRVLGAQTRGPEFESTEPTLKGYNPGLWVPETEWMLAVSLAPDSVRL